MKVIFEGRMCVVIEWKWEGLQLETMEEPVEQVFAPFSSPDLIIEPTDEEVATIFGVSWRQSGDG